MTEWLFETARLRARRWDPDHDAEAAFAIYGDPEVTRFIGTGPKSDVAAVHAMLTAAVERYRALPPTFGSFPLFSKESDELIGTALLKPLPDREMQPSGSIEIGWHLRRTLWGQGYATEAARAVITRGFEAGEPELYAVVEPPNARSLAVARRLGMTHRGRTDRYYGGIELELFVLPRDAWSAFTA